MKITDPAQFKAPWLPFEEIKKRADEFRKTYWGSDNVPVDILLIAEEKLKLNIVPIKNFKMQNDIEALLYDGGKSLAVDETEYMDDRFLNRIRYSVAHEIAHIVLHKDLYSSFNYSNIEQWIETIDSIPDEEYNWIEQQAYEFAGRLLVPINKLEATLKSIQAKIKLYKASFPDSGNNLLKEHVASMICKEFGVSASVISKRIEREKLENYF